MGQAELQRAVQHRLFLDLHLSTGNPAVILEMPVPGLIIIILRHNRSC